MNVHSVARLVSTVRRARHHAVALASPRGTMRSLRKLVSQLSAPSAMMRRQQENRDAHDVSALTTRRCRSVVSRMVSGGTARLRVGREVVVRLLLGGRVP